MGWVFLTWLCVLCVLCGERLFHCERHRGEGSTPWLPRRHLHQSIVRVDVIDGFRRDELVLDEDRWWHGPAVEDVERDGDDFRAVLLGEVRD